MKIAIVHYGEDLPGDPGYRPLRYGRFAEDWTAAGHEVVRIAPSFSHLRRTTRSVDRASSIEGNSVIVKTSGYDASKGWSRLRFLLQFAVRSAVACKREGPDIVLAGYPPPLQVGVLRLVGVRVPIVADVRDIWFDHRIRRSKLSEAIVSVLSRLARFDLRRATEVMALSEDMADWSGVSGALVAPIGVVQSASEMTVEPPSGPLEFIFVGTLTPSFALVETIEGWPSGRGAPRLTIAGDGPLRKDVERMSADNPNVQYLGRIPSDQVPALLARADVGLAPTVAGFGTTLSNKVCEYLALGLYVLHSLEPRPASNLAQHKLGVGFSPTAVSDLDAARERIRGDRMKRAAVALEHFGAAKTSAEVLLLLEKTVDKACELGP